MLGTISVLAIGNGTHEENVELALTMRAFGASEIIFSCKEDRKILRKISAIDRLWGGKFRVRFEKDYKEVLKNAPKSKKIYLTRFGEPLQSRIGLIRSYKNIVLIITQKDYEKGIYDSSDFNISVTSQPIAAVSASAVFLHDYYNGRELAMHFERARYKIVARGSRIELHQRS